MLDIAQALERYQKEVAMRTRSKDQRTVTTYSYPLRTFLRYLKEKHNIHKGSPVDILTTQQAMDFLLWLEAGGHGEKLQDSTLDLYLVVLSDFYGFLTTERLVDIDPGDLEAMRRRFRNIRRRLIRKLPRDYTDDVIKAIIAAARAVPSDPEKPRQELRRLRDIAIVECLRSSGMRVGELVDMRRGDLNPEGRSADIIGKGRVQRRVFFDKPAWRALQTYLAARNDGARDGPLYQKPVFARHDRRAGDKVLPLSTRSVESIIERLVKLADVPEGVKITPHAFRHYFATKFLAESRNLAVVQDALGHASPDTTRIYARVRPVDLEEAYRDVWGE